MSLSTEWVDEVLDAVKEKYEALSKALDEQVSDRGPGMRPITNEEHRIWFENMVRGHQDPATGELHGGPLWLMALPYVEGGPREYKRYLATIGREPETAMMAGTGGDDESL